MTDEWVPLGYSDDEREHYHVLVDGVPEFMRIPVCEWLGLQLAGGRAGSPVEMGLIHRLQAILHMELLAADQSHAQGYYVAQVFASYLDDLSLLRVIDAVLAERMIVSAASIRPLADLLEVNKSKYRIGERLGKLGLVERVAEGVQDFTEGVIRSSGRGAGELLARAWANIHGLEKNATQAYADAVRAAEVAAIAVVSPNNRSATLGTVIRQMTDQKDWALPLQRGPADLSSGDLLLGMMRTLWNGHRDRHGAADYSDVNDDEARVAVGLAATLVDWFTSGAVTRSP